ncbi:uncharacterized protein LOC123542373 [Mercenaria mercenaria]|uniref:uncharacterized protein LOC123542373 n=1 Tax=Mercenaria mercenaria TaxID=6596 RepID=UPI00234EBA7A|nr:uncharacterized protein LOC123542373 [Mercenaria mercenaria]
MCNSFNILLACLCSLLIAAVLSAPVSKDNFDDIKAALKAQLKDQEKALESLASVPNTGSNGIQYSKTKSFSYSNVNGAESKHEKAEEKVSEPETEKLLSDIQEELNEERPSPDVKPLTSYKASLDVPSEGIHKEISNNGENQPELFDDISEQPGSEEGLANMKQTLEFTPRVVAEYLYKTGESQEFQSLLNDLVESSEITSEEAEQYEKAVMDELYKIEQEQNNNELEELYQPGYADVARPIFPMYGSMQGPRDVYPLYGYGQNTGKTSQDNMDDYINYMLNKPVTLDEMINTVIDTWLTNAIVNGDPEAEEILSNIVDYVSRDNDPNDEEQVKAILGDIFAEAILEDLAPRIQPQDVQIGEDQLPVAQTNSDETEESAVNQDNNTDEEIQKEAAEQLIKQTAEAQSEEQQEGIESVKRSAEVIGTPEMKM